MPLTLTCPFPTNINPLSPNGFQFSIQKLPEITFFCQEAGVPGISLDVADMDTPLSVIHHPGEKLQMETLEIEFIVDEGMLNRKALHNWLVGLGFPESHDQYKNFIEDQPGVPRLQREFSDATLQILGSNNLSVQTVRFIDLFPFSMSSMRVMTTSTDVNYLVTTASFYYSYYYYV